MLQSKASLTSNINRVGSTISSTWEKTRLLVVSTAALATETTGQQPVSLLVKLRQTATFSKWSSYSCQPINVWLLLVAIHQTTRCIAKSQGQKMSLSQ